MSKSVRKAIELAQRKPEPKQYFYSLPEALKNDFYVVSLWEVDTGKARYVRGVSEQGVQVFGDPGLETKVNEVSVAAGPAEEGAANEYPDEQVPVQVAVDQEPAHITIPWSEIKRFRVEFKHYWQGYTFPYRSPRFFTVGQVLRLQYFYRFSDRARQFAFNLRSIRRAQRMQVLQYMVESTIKNRKFLTSAPQLIWDLHTKRVYGHPDKDRVLNHTTLILNSLVASKDLHTDGASYSLNPAALGTLSQWEEDDRRHLNSVRQQRRIMGLTVVLAFGALVQAAALIEQHFPMLRFW